MDPRRYPEGRNRVYLSPAHMDLHPSRCGFFVETFGHTYMMGHYDENGEHATHIDGRLYRAFVAEAKENAKELKESCGIPACKQGLENWKMIAVGVKP